MQIQQYNIYHINIITMKNIIISKNQKKKNQFVIKNTNKIILAEVAKTLSLINFNSKYIQIINNIHIYIAKNFKFTSIIKYQKYTSQIKGKVNELHKNWILILIIFMKYF